MCQEGAAPAAMIMRLRRCDCGFAFLRGAWNTTPVNFSTLFNARLQDKEGKPENLRDLLAEVKSLAPEFFPDDKKPPGSADGGKQGEANTATNMNDLIRRAAGRQV
jgi:hypothetical protein